VSRLPVALILAGASVAGAAPLLGAALPRLLACLAVVWGLLLAGTVLRRASDLRRGRSYRRPTRYDDPDMYRRRSG
jgi:hypothetical protein